MKVEGWTRSQLQNLISEFIVPMRDKPPSWAGETPWCRIEDIDGKFLLGSKSNQVVDDKIIRSMNLKIFPIGTVLCSCSARLGVCAIVGRELVSNQTFIGLVPCEKVDSEYLYYKMISQAELLQSLSSGTTIPYLPREKFETFEIDHPVSKLEQEKIAEVLSTVDRAIAQTEALIAKQQRIKTGLMQDLLTKGIDENGNIRSEETHEFKDSAIGRIPVEWEVDVLDNLLIEKRYGVSSSLSEEPIGIPVLRMNNLFSGEIDFSDIKYSNQEDAKSLILNNLDVLFNRTNSIDYVGRTAIYRQQEQSTSFASYLVRLVPNHKKLDPEYLNLWLNNEKNQIRVKQFATLGVQQANINPTNLGTIILAFPRTVVEQKRIIKALSIGKKNIEKYNLNLQKLRFLKTGLMQDLLTGKVRVTPLLENLHNISQSKL